MLSFFWGVDHPLGPSAYAACPVLMMMMMMVVSSICIHITATRSAGHIRMCIRIWLTELG